MSTILKQIHNFIWYNKEINVLRKQQNKQQRLIKEGGARKQDNKLVKKVNN